MEEKPLTLESIYSQTRQILEQLGQARQTANRLSMELAEAIYHQNVAQAKVERGLIKRVGGEKALAPTADDRSRIFTLALDADAEYKDRLKRSNQIRMSLDKVKTDITGLKEQLGLNQAVMNAMNRAGCPHQSDEP